MSTSVEYAEEVSLLTIVTDGEESAYLVPGKQYSYALLMTESADDMTELESNLVTLQDARNANATIALSANFTADGPPSGGVISLLPLSGEAVLTAFSATTTGWVDEDVDELSFAFFRFPLGEGYNVTADGKGGLLIGTDFNWRLPEIDWHDPQSPRYFSKQGGLLLRSWSKSKFVADMTLAVGMYVTIARARDKYGAESTGVAIGPVTGVPSGGLGADQAADVLRSSYASGDADVILNAVDAISSVPATAEASSQMLHVVMGGLEVATTVVESTPAAVEKISQVLSGTLVQGSEATSDATVLSRATAVLFNIVDVATTGELGGLGKQEGDAVMQTLATLQHGRESRWRQNQSLLSEDERDELQEEGEAVTEELLHLLSKIGTAALAKLAVGQTQELQGTGVGGRGISTQVSKADMAASRKTGIKEGRLSVPGALLPNVSLDGRRLSSNCGTVELQATAWEQSNLYAWADPRQGDNKYVRQDATVVVVELSMCGSIFTFSEGENLSLLLDIPARVAAPPGYVNVPRCMMWQEFNGNASWLFDGMQVQGTVYWDDTQATCLAGSGGGAYSIVWFPEFIPTTTTLPPYTTSEYQEWEYPPKPDNLIEKCSYALSDMPDLPPGSNQWNCTGPRAEGDVCAAPCQAYHWLEASIVCLKSGRFMEWVVLSDCPEVVTPSPYVQMPDAADDAEVVEGVLNTFVLAGLGAGIGAALAIAYLVWRCCFVHDDIIILRRLKIKDDEETAREMNPEWSKWVEKFAIGPSGIKKVKVKVVEEVVEEPEEEDPYAAMSSKKAEPPPIPKAEMLPIDKAFQGWAAEWSALQVPHQVPEEDESPRLAKGAPERLDSRGSEKSEVLIDIPALEDGPRLALSLPADASLGREEEEEVPLRALADAGATIIVGTWPPVLKIFQMGLNKGSFDEDGKLSDGSSMKIDKIYPLDAVFDTPDVDIPAAAAPLIGLRRAFGFCCE